MVDLLCPHPRPSLIWFPSRGHFFGAAVDCCVPLSFCWLPVFVVHSAPFRFLSAVAPPDPVCTGAAKMPSVFGGPLASVPPTDSTDSGSLGHDSWLYAASVLSRSTPSNSILVPYIYTTPFAAALRSCMSHPLRAGAPLESPVCHRVCLAVLELPSIVCCVFLGYPLLTFLCLSCAIVSPSVLPELSCAVWPLPLDACSFSSRPFVFYSYAGPSCFLFPPSHPCASFPRRRQASSSRR